MSVKLKPKSPITDFLHHKVIIKNDPKKAHNKTLAGLEGRVIAVAKPKKLTVYQIHFAKAELKGNVKLNDLWFTKEQFTLTR